MAEHMVGRREFMGRTPVVTASALTAASYSRVMGANDTVQLGLIGAGDRGRHDMQEFQTDAKVKVAAVCDVYAQQIDLAKQKAPGAQAFSDHRKLLEMKELDVVLIATPDHWHCRTAIDALNAGKDVYVEKPLTLKIEEGPEMVKAARVNDRVCQVGMQQRSGKHYLEAKRDYIDAGKLGKVTLARTWWHGNSYHLRRAPASLQTRPSNLDWAHFLGPLKWRDYDPQQYFNWRAYLDYGGGQVTDLFTHWIDVVHMFLGPDVPNAAVAAGGVYNYKDGRTAPDTINVLLEYGGQYTATFEATLAPGIRGAAVEICGTEGRLMIDRSQYVFTPAGRGAQPVVVKADRGDVGEDLLTRDHVYNFLECVRSRKRPNGDVLIGHRSAQASHLGNIAYIQKRRIDFDPIREEILPF
jgi:predicted dehydrogenase